MPPKKKIAALVKVQLQAGAATPAPPVGTALGPHGVNIMEFCKAYNAQTESMRGNVIPVEITIYEDRSFTFITKTPPAAELIKKAAGLKSGSGTPPRQDHEEEREEKCLPRRRSLPSSRCSCRPGRQLPHRPWAPRSAPTA